MAQVEGSISTPSAAADALEKVTMEEVTDSSSQQQQQQQQQPSNARVGTSSNKSALQENIDRKGKNSYYFAHAHKATGPEWDGKAEPKLLARLPSEDTNGDANNNTTTTKTALKRNMSSSFDYQKSNITAYAFSDEGKHVKLYITLDNVGDECKDENVELEFTESSLSLVVNNYKDEEQPRCLCFTRLAAKISSAKFKIKKDRIILTLVKVDPETQWHTINDKGTPDHELV